VGTELKNFAEAWTLGSPANRLIRNSLVIQPLRACGRLMAPFQGPRACDEIVLPQ
jgi:hypothetical protein